MELREPRLYAPAEDGKGAVLLALRDPATGALTFPRSPHAAPGQEEVELDGKAALLACITLHQPVLPGVVPPLVVARLQLDAGLVVDGVLVGTAEPPPGTRMRAVLVEQDGALDCRFQALA
ncbi:PhlB family protein [Falsiroseomonas tokyonensis]|uniref:DUF35 domain-containing protein n=1 Tax=Falsiroseomonas tokyonensis TaxID=430521 RepID=A0ABV7BU88_9PROT|nr:hypothetical protein [Falsiroseomonas tokyonensis]MBU8539235.1 hypothetical protein [Falsiroseomonas tokyonensis]